MIKNEDGSVTLTAEEYARLMDREDKLSWLEFAGVDNWSGWAYAKKMRRACEEELARINQEES